MSFLIACASNSAQPTPVITISTDTPFPTSTDFPTPTPLLPDEQLNAPNGKFIGRTFHSYSNNQFSQSLEIIDAAGTPIASFSHRQPLRPVHEYLSMVGWSPDSRYLYYYYSWGPDGVISFFDGFNLQSIDSISGNITPLVNGYMAFSFSPSGTYLAFARNGDQPHQLTIRNLDNKAEQILEIQLPIDEFTQVGWIFWAPAEDGLIYFTSVKFNYSMHYLPLNTMKPMHLIDCEMEIDWCEFDQWLDNEIVRVNKVDKVLEINVKSGLVVNTSAPTPSP